MEDLISYLNPKTFNSIEELDVLIKELNIKIEEENRLASKLRALRHYYYHEESLNNRLFFLNNVEPLSKKQLKIFEDCDMFMKDNKDEKIYTWNNQNINTFFIVKFK